MNLRSWTRIGVVVLLVLALINPAWYPISIPVQTLVLLDRSMSMAGEADSTWTHLRNTLVNYPDESRVSLISFGADARIDIEDERTASLADSEQRPAAAPLDASGTNIENALRLAAQRIRYDMPSRTVLVTDGMETIGDATAFLAGAKAANLPLPYLFATGSGHDLADAAIVDVHLPTRVALGSRVDAYIDIDSNRDGPATLKVSGSREVLLETVIGPSSTTRASIPLTFDTPGPQILAFTIEQAGDENPANNTRRTIVNVSGPAKIIYVTTQEASALAGSLSDGGWNVSSVRPQHLPQALADLPANSVIILDNIAVAALAESGWGTLVDAARHDGVGLIVLGGDRSFAAGGYLDSTLESILPVTSEAGTPTSRAAMLFVVDKSGSMGASAVGGTPFDYAREAVLGATRLIDENDLSGVIAFDTKPVTWLELARHADPVSATESIWHNNPSGGTNIVPAILEASEQLSQSKVDERILILITDGFTTDDDYDLALRRLVDHDIDLIAIAIGEEPDLAVLRRLTTREGSLLVPVTDVLSLPHLVNETVGAHRFTYEAGPIRPSQVKPLPFGITDSSWPELRGYMVTRARDNAEVYLTAPRGDPLLAMSSAGLGRVVVLPAGLGDYAAAWLGWQSYGSFIGGLTHWVSNQSADRSLHFDIDNTSGRLMLAIDAVEAGGDWHPDKSVELVLRDPVGRTKSFTAEAKAPGRFETRIPVAGSGDYAIGIRLADTALTHAFIFDAPAELSRGRAVSDNWQAQQLVLPWPDTMPEFESGSTTRSGFVALAALLYFLSFVPFPFPKPGVNLE